MMQLWSKALLAEPQKKEPLYYCWKMTDYGMVLYTYTKTIPASVPLFYNKNSSQANQSSELTAYPNEPITNATINGFTASGVLYYRRYIEGDLYK